MCKKNIIFSLFLYLATNSFGQNLEWVQEETGAYSTLECATDIDTEGNLFTTNNFTGTIDVDPGVNVVNLTSSFGVDMSFRKINSLGAFVWAKHISGSGQGFIKDIKVDLNHNVFVCGSFTGTFDFDPSSNVSNKTCSDIYGDAFLAKYDSNGDFLWVKTISGNQKDETETIELDHLGSVYAYSSIFGNVDLNPDSGIVDTLGMNGSGFAIQKFSNSGVLNWANSSPKLSNYTINNSQELIAVSKFRNTIELGSLSLTSNGLNDCFIAKMNEMGLWETAMKLGGLSDDEINDVAVDAENNIFISGYFENSLIWNDNLMNTVGTNSKDFFLAKLTNNFIGGWFNSYPKDDKTKIVALETDDNGNVLFAGQFKGNLDLGGYSSELVNNSAVSNSFFGKLKNDGMMVWSNSFSSSGLNISIDLNIYSSNMAFISGKFTNETSFGLNGNSPDLTPTNAWSGGLYHSKVKFCEPITSNKLDYFCDSFIAPSGKQITTIGIHQDTISSSSGCDSIISFDLNDFVAEIVLENDTLVANIPNAQYKWLDCNAGNVAIENAISKKFYPTVPGKYAVEITRDECVAISNCFNLEPFGSHESELEAVTVSPNPNTGRFQINFNGLSENIEFTIANAIGEVLKKENRTTSGVEYFELDYPAGVYFLTLKLPTQETKVFRVIRK